MLVGAGVKKNTVFGKTGDVGLTPGRFDLTTGLPSDNGISVLPEDIVATILASANLDYSITRTQPIRALIAP
jgi:hypothetical protein